MATKNAVCREVYGLNTSEYAFVLALDSLDKGIPEHKLSEKMLLQKGAQIKVLGEALAMYQQVLPEDTQEQVDALDKGIKAMSTFLKNYAKVLERELEKTLKAKNGKFAAVYAKFEQDKTNFPASIAEAQQKIHELRNANLIKANSHVADSLAKRRNNTNATNGSQPPLEEGKSYLLKGYGLEGVTLVYTDSTHWTFSQNGETLAKSAKFPSVKLGTWTPVGRVLRILSKSYTHAKEGWTVQRGELDNKDFSKGNAGGTQTFEAVLS